MKIAIKQIKVAARIRKVVNNVEEIADNIRKHGLITPIAVMELEGGEYQLLAGLRRLRAMELNGETEIDAKVFPAADAEEALRIEYAENDQREAFTYSEMMDYAGLIKDIEAAKALERKSIGGKGGFDEDVTQGTHLEQGRSREVIGGKIGMSGVQYQRAQYIAKNAPQEIIDELDRGERTIRSTYDEMRKADKSGTKNQTKSDTPLRDKKAPPATDEVAPKTNPSPVTKDVSPKTPVVPDKSPKSPKLSDKAKEERAMAMLSPKDREAVERHNAFYAMSPEEKITELQSQLKAERTRAITAETELSRLKDELHNAVYHRDGIISSLERQLADAHARIEELAKGQGDVGD